MLDRLAPLAHLLGMFIKPTLNGFENVLMLPSRDPSLFASGAVSFDGAALTGGPVAELVGIEGGVVSGVFKPRII